MTQANGQTGLVGTIRGCSSWLDIQAKWRGLPEKQKGDLFEELVKAYLQLEPEYANKLKQVWLLREVPQAVARNLKLPATDQGIDLVAETHDGDFWAFQCKYRHDTDHSLTWREISTFTGLAFGVCQGFTFGIICSTTERITHVLKDQERIGFCALDVWQALDAGFLTRLRAHLVHKPQALKPLRPHPHQKGAVKDGHAHFVTGKARRGKLIMPCGSGKSLTSYWIAGKLAARRIIIAVPSLALIRQTLKVWLRETLANHQTVDWICVCSDESAGRIERDDTAVLRQDLGVPCLTEPQAIAAWLKRKHRGLTVVFTTYQSGEALAMAARSAGFTFDLGIMDEAHKTVGDSNKLFSHLLHDANLSIRRRLFMTATERRYAGQSDTVLSMDDPAVYGETFHLLSFKRAMEYAPPILCDYKIISIAVSRAEIADLIRNNVFVRPDAGPWNQEIEADMLASLIALRKAMKKYPIRHAVSFHGSIQRAESFKTHNDAFTKAFRKYGKLATFHVSGKTPTGTRARIIGEFARAERALITNARCLTEGVDVPGIDCVLFADPRRSAVDIVQAVGRALRPAPNKQFGYVIVPILHDTDATANDIFQSTAFKEILTTLRALAANDDRIIEYFRTAAHGQQRTGGGSVTFDLDERLAKHIDLTEFVREIELKCWDRLAKLSWRPFEEAREYVRSLLLSDNSQWRKFTKGKLPKFGIPPVDIPVNPDRVYVERGWQSWGDWLGTGTVATNIRRYRSFEDAREFVHELALTSEADWKSYCKGELAQKSALPSDVPSSPVKVFRLKGWVGWGDWLGTGTVASYLRQYRSFEDAREFARDLGHKSRAEWKEYCKGFKDGKLPQDIPAKPDNTYANRGWSGWGDWLGTGAVASYLRQYRSFEDAREFARSLGFNNQSKWFNFCRGKMPEKCTLPPDISASPHKTYANKGWKGWGDWLGTGRVSNNLRQYRAFDEARVFARGLGLKGVVEWIRFCRGDLRDRGSLPPDIPAKPESTYKGKGWQGFGDWLGTGNIAYFRRTYRTFENARNFVQKLGLKNQSEWKSYCEGKLPEKGNLPSDIPATPSGTYAKKGWAGMGDWLGTGHVASFLRQFRAFEDARIFARRLGLKNVAEWRNLCIGKLPGKGVFPTDIPTNPGQTYADKGWAGWGDWLGTGTVAPRLRQYRPFEDACDFARNLKLKSEAEWKQFCRGSLPDKVQLPSDIPSKPQGTYAGKGWSGWGVWLGTGNVAKFLRQFRTFEDARDFSRDLGLKGVAEWIQFSKGNLPEKGYLPSDIPSQPSQTYADKGWMGMGDWLGTGKIANHLRQYRQFDEARAFAQGLGLKSQHEWFDFCKGKLPEKGTLPPDIPVSPRVTYTDKGWAGYGDWLGTGRTRVSKSTKCD